MILPGFYGKLPTAGDFVTRRLPDFVRSWDRWCARHLAPVPAARWPAGGLRFHLPGQATGLALPSRDRSGRAFPLTLAAPAPHQPEGWYDDLARLGLAAADGRIGPDALDDGLRLLPAQAAGGHRPSPPAPLARRRPRARGRPRPSRRAGGAHPAAGRRGMWSLSNSTPYKADRGWVRDMDGREVWLVAVRARYLIDAAGALHLAERERAAGREARPRVCRRRARHGARRRLRPAAPEARHRPDRPRTRPRSRGLRRRAAAREHAGGQPAQGPRGLGRPGLAAHRAERAAALHPHAAQLPQRLRRRRSRRSGELVRAQPGRQGLQRQPARAQRPARPERRARRRRSSPPAPTGPSRPASRRSPATGRSAGATAAPTTRPGSRSACRCCPSTSTRASTSRPRPTSRSRASSTAASPSSSRACTPAAASASTCRGCRSSSRPSSTT